MQAIRLNSPCYTEVHGKKFPRKNKNETGAGLFRWCLLEQVDFCGLGRRFDGSDRVLVDENIPVSFDNYAKIIKTLDHARMNLAREHFDIHTDSFTSRLI
jgi:hypothetical protein